MRSTPTSYLGVAGLAGTVALISQLTFSSEAMAQGCVAVRGGMCLLSGAQHPEGHDFADQPWQINLAYRWLHSDRHFSGDDEHPNRQIDGTEVINDSHFLDLTVSYQFNSRYSAAFTLPTVSHHRTSFYEHTGGSPASGGVRGSSGSSGIGDIRLTGYAWLWDPAKMPKGNVQLGLGIKAPTGDYQAADTFYHGPARGSELHYVDQSIQPGDGGWGFTAEMFAYREIVENVTLYAQTYYLFSPRDVNGVSTTTRNPRGRTITALNNTINSPTASAADKATAQTRLNAATALGYNNLESLEDVMSVADQYLARGGVTYMLWKEWGLAISLGARLEGVPVEDAIGDSNGFRRPGYTVSVEPGISMMKGRYTAAINAPVALYRNRSKSVADERWDQITGVVNRGGDAAFADFLISASFGVRF